VQPAAQLHACTVCHNKDWTLTCARCFCVAVQAVAANPSIFDQPWRSGVLTSVLFTLCKRGRSVSITQRGCSVSFNQLSGSQAMPWVGVLSGLLQSVVPEPGEEPWFAGSAERQQYAMLVLSHVGTQLAAAVLQLSTLPAMGAEELELVAEAVDSAHAAAEQLAQPPLRQLLEVAAPALLPLADEVGAAVQQPACNVGADGGGLAQLQSALQPRHVKLLASVAQQLDPLALSLALPGCYNPACTCLAGASEADMPLKRCAGCKTAR